MNCIMVTRKLTQTIFTLAPNQHELHNGDTQTNTNQHELHNGDTQPFQVQTATATSFINAFDLVCCATLPMIK